ncbi:MAG: inositol monophosphatase family protein, partial [Miltoncostaeaceae bacterium]
MSSAERRRPVGAGAGGDVTVRVDALAEEAILSAIEPIAADGGGALLIAEEGGHRQIGGPADRTTVVVDPIDGSLNAKRALPIFSTSVAVADGPSMDDVWLGYVRDHGSGATHVAERGRGAWRDGRPLAVRPEAATLVVAFE